MSKPKWEYEFKYVETGPGVQLHVQEMQVQGWEIVSTSWTGDKLLFTWKRWNGI